MLASFGVEALLQYTTTSDPIYSSFRGTTDPVLTTPMTYVPPQPNLSSTPRIVSGMASPAVHFGGMSANLKRSVQASSVRVSQNIVEKFLWSFLALDVLGMWLLRMKVALERGRIPYDANQDPSMQGKPLTVQVKKSVVENTKGLNWINFIEEASRELATGPGVLIIPTLLFSIARRGFAQQATILGYSPLKQLSQGFIQHLDALPADHVLKQPGLPQDAFQTAYRDTLKQYVGGLLNDPKLAGTNLAEAFTANPALKKALSAEQLAELPDKPMGEYFAEKMNHWLDTAYQTVDGKAEKAAQRQQLAGIEAPLKTLLMERYNKTLKIADHPDVLYQADVVKFKHGEKSLSTFFEELHRWTDYAETVAKEHLKTPGSKLVDVAKGVYQRTIAKKGLLNIGAVALCGSYLIYLAKLVQSHDQYPGERLSHLNQQKTAQQPPATGGVTYA